MIYRCEFCDAEYDSDMKRCRKLRLNVLTQKPYFCWGKLKAVEPCPECGCLEYQCKCEREQFEDR